MNRKIAFCMLLISMVCIGCGRKLPPLPPGEPDPVEILSIKFVDDAITVKAQCNEAGGKVILLGKPKGICPACTDDLVKKQEVVVEKPGVVFLNDPSPGSEYMVYRLSFEKGTAAWMTKAQVVTK